jgi:hypothetical protein
VPAAKQAAVAVLKEATAAARASALQVAVGTPAA